MIKNERQYRITKAQAAGLARSIDRLDDRDGEPDEVHPRIAQAKRMH